MLSANIEKNPDKVLSRAHNLAVSSTETKAGEDDYTPAFVHYYKYKINPVPYNACLLYQVLPTRIYLTKARAT